MRWITRASWEKCLEWGSRRETCKNMPRMSETHFSSLKFSFTFARTTVSRKKSLIKRCIMRVMRRKKMWVYTHSAPKKRGRQRKKRESLCFVDYRREARCFFLELVVLRYRVDWTSSHTRLSSFAIQPSHEGILSRFCEQQKLSSISHSFSSSFFAQFIEPELPACVSSAHSLAYNFIFIFFWHVLRRQRKGEKWEGKAEKYFYSWFLIILFFAHVELQRNLCVCQKKSFIAVRWQCGEKGCVVVFWAGEEH